MWSLALPLAVFLLIAYTSHALYSPNSDVITVFDDSKFKSEVLKHPGVAVVEFYGKVSYFCPFNLSILLIFLPSLNLVWLLSSLVRTLQEFGA